MGKAKHVITIDGVSRPFYDGYSQNLGLQNTDKINDGIQLSFWQEWVGEIITLKREDTRWVWSKLQELEQLTAAMQDLTNLTQSQAKEIVGLKQEVEAEKALKILCANALQQATELYGYRVVEAEELKAEIRLLRDVVNTATSDGKPQSAERHVSARDALKKFDENREGKA